MNTSMPATLKRFSLTRIMAVALLVFTHATSAAVPDGISYQAFLTNDDGSPVDTTVTIAFGLYNVDLGGIPLWSDTYSVNVEQGLFSVTLGNPVNPLPAGLFEGPVFLGLFVAGEEMLPRRPFSSNAYSFKSLDSDTVGGQTAASLDQSSDVSSLQTGLSGVSGDVAAVQGTVSSNESRITNLEATAGDITGVSAGSGLTGGGAAGNVALAIAPAGITNSMLAPGAVSPINLANNSVTGAAIADGTVTSQDIADDSIQPQDIWSFGNFALNGLTVGPQSFSVESSFDILILDDFNGFRWYSTDGLEQFAAITARSAEVSFYDHNVDREIIESNAAGVSIATSTRSAGYDVTVPNLSVLGSVGMGHERVSASYDLDVEIAQCHSHGNLPCFYGSTTVSCPVGKKVLSGGTNGVTPRYGAISINYPSSDTSWTCGNSYDITTSRTCYAVCARMD